MNNLKKKQYCIHLYCTDVTCRTKKTYHYHFVDFVLLTCIYYVFCVGFPFCYSNKDKMGKMALSSFFFNRCYVESNKDRISYATSIDIYCSKRMNPGDFGDFPPRLFI